MFYSEQTVNRNKAKMYKTNYHSHSTFCDGKSTMEAMVVAAIEHGFSHWGVSSHAPVPFPNTFAIKQEDIKAYLGEFKRLKEIYSDRIHLYLGMELDFITDIMEDIKEQAKDYGLDYFIGSVHQVKEHNDSMDSWFIDGHDQGIYDRELKELFDNDIRRGCEAYFSQQIRMIETNKPDILGHCDKITMHNKGRFFTNDTPWYEEMVRSLLDTVKQYDIITEINTRGLYKKRNDDFYPALKWLRIAKEKGIKITISTDCHKADETDLFYQQALDSAKAIGFTHISYFENEWKEQKID